MLNAKIWHGQIVWKNSDFGLAGQKGLKMLWILKIYEKSDILK